MTSGILKYAVYVGASSYFVCYATNQTNAFEKAILVTVLVGLRGMARQAVEYQRNDKDQLKPFTRVLIASADLLAIPCALFAGRVFNLKAADYLQIVGLTSLGYTVKYGLDNLSSFLPNWPS